MMETESRGLTTILRKKNVLVFVFRLAVFACKGGFEPISTTVFKSNESIVTLASNSLQSKDR